MKNHDYFISVDWGTSNFRLSLVETDSLKVVSERKTDGGIKKLYQLYLEQSRFGQFDFFSRYLLDQVRTLPTARQKHPIVLSGMVSANIGMYELEYAAMPFGKSGKELIKKQFVFPNGGHAILISGAKSESGMMRGEEVQALGLADQLDAYGDGLLLLPGTHSKHLTYRKGKFTHLTTMMTGELFELLSSKSILENNLTPATWNQEKENAFLNGLELGFDRKLSSSLFSIRSRHLLQNEKKEDNYFFLSGLLIGDELSYLKEETAHLFLAAPAATQALYTLAFEKLLPHHQLVIFDDRVIANALLRGQRKILSVHEK